MAGAGIGDPDDGAGFRFRSVLLAASEPGDQHGGEAGRPAPVAGLRGADFGQPGQRQPAAERLVEGWEAQWAARCVSFPARGASAFFRHGTSFRRLAGKAFRKPVLPALHAGYDLAQGMNRPLRPFGGRHVELRKCSCYVPIDSRGRIKSQAARIGIYSSAWIRFGIP